ncbi:MAG: hypothetical protein HKM95_12370 [Inquilinus sp.]|nr:hypothetical protein [Inquilinus sp.]
MIRQILSRLAPDHGPEVPLRGDGADRFVPWLIAPMAYLATLSLAAVMATASLVDGWDVGLAGSLTIQIRAEGDAAADQAVSTGEALSVLRGWPGVERATPIDQPEIAALMEPWLGDDLPLDQLPLPTLIDVTLSGDPPIDLAALSAALRETVDGVSVDDHAVWLDDLRTVANTVVLFAALLMALISLASIATIVFVTRAGLAIHRNVIDLLHTIGATDTYVARQFEWYAFALGLRGAAIGFGLALATLFAITRLFGGGDAGPTLLTVPGLSEAQWVSLVLVPVGAIVLAATTARRTVLHTLARMP